MLPSFKSALSFALFCVPYLIFSPYAFANPSFTIKNNTSFYLNNSSPQDHPWCPSQIAPGESAQAQDYWCGFNACDTKFYDAAQGCQEFDNDNNTKKKGGKVQGGWATYFSVSLGGKTCTVANTSNYTCSFDGTNLNLVYGPKVQTYSSGPSIGQVVTIPQPKTFESIPFRGVNISGMEYDGTFLDALFQKPDLPDAKYFVEQGMNTVRFPIRWEYLVSDNENSLAESHHPQSKVLNPIYMSAIKDTITKYLEAGLNVDLDLHNYMRFCPTGEKEGQRNEPTDDPTINGCTIVNQADLSYIWSLIIDNLQDLAQKYSPKNGQNQLIFGLMNEPNPDLTNTPTTTDVFNRQVALIKMIRNEKKCDNLILVSGNNWDAMHGWAKETPDHQSNGEVFTLKNFHAAGISDTTNIALEMHQYLDKDFSGRYEQCNVYQDAADFQNQLGLDKLAVWMNENNMKVFLGEFGAANNPTCQQDLNYLLDFVKKNADVGFNKNASGFIGWTAWRANRHGNAGFSSFNYLQFEDATVYGATGIAGQGLGIVQGQGNGLMNSVLKSYLN